MLECAHALHTARNWIFVVPSRLECGPTVACVPSAESHANGSVDQTYSRVSRNLQLEGQGHFSAQMSHSVHHCEDLMLVLQKEARPTARFLFKHQPDKSFTTQVNKL